jgi:uncharacterized DUF497 family protein
MDLRKVVGFEWDDGNARKSFNKHGVDRVEAEQIFFTTPLFVVSDPGHSQGETRLHALGKTWGGRFLHVTFTLRADDTRIRVISARDMHRKERRLYEEKTKIDS